MTRTCLMQPLAEIRSLVLRHAIPGQSTSAIPGVSIMSAFTRTAPIRSMYEPVFALIAQGRKRTVLADNVFEYGDGQFLVASVGLPITAHIIEASRAKPFIGVGFTLSAPTIASLLLDAPPAPRAPVEAVGIAVSDSSPELLEAIARLLRLLDKPQDIPVLRSMIEREILWRLLTGDQGAMIRQIGLADSRLSQINHAIRWIRQHYSEAILIEELAKLSAMSVSSFHRHFRAITAMSPIQYQKQVRMQEARRQLLSESHDVASVGFRVGYESASQFSREYRRFFGAPPGQDQARLRAHAPVAEVPAI